MQILEYIGIFELAEILNKCTPLCWNYKKILCFSSISNRIFQKFLQNYKNLPKTDNIFSPIIRETQSKELYFTEHFGSNPLVLLLWSWIFVPAPLVLLLWSFSFGLCSLVLFLLSCSFGLDPLFTFSLVLILYLSSLV